MKRGFLLSAALVITLISFGIFLYRTTAPGSMAASPRPRPTGGSRRPGGVGPAFPDRPAGSPANLAALLREWDARPQPDQREKLQADRLERFGRALELFRKLSPPEFGSYPPAIDALGTSDTFRRIMLDALFRAWGEKAPEEAMAAAETRTGDDAREALAGWAASDLNAPWQWLAAHPGMTPILGMPKANYLEVLIPAMAEHGQLDTLAALVNEIPEKPVKEFALSFFVSAAMRQSPEYMDRWLKEIPSKDLGLPASAAGGYLAQQGLEAVHEFASRLPDATQDLIINGAVMNWTLNGRGDTVLEYVKRYPGPDDASDDRLLRAIGTASILGNPEASLQLLGSIRNPEMRDVSLEGAAALLTGSAPVKAIKFAQSISDTARQEKRLELIVTAVTKRSPNEARSLVEGSHLPETAKTTLKNVIERHP